MARDPRPHNTGKAPDFEVAPDSRLQVHSLPHVPTQPIPPRTEAADFDLKTILDQQRIQTIMDDFHALTGMVTAILDLEGNILEATGWQDLCTKFHRVHPTTSRNCTESDLALAATLEPGQYADYHCKNGLRDVVTPLYIRNQHVGNIFTGQFFYDDDEVSEGRFIEQARRYGFDEDEYLAALRRIPRYSRETIAHLMSFLVRMTEHISQIGLVNLELAAESSERQAAVTAWQDSRKRLQAVLHALPDMVWMKDPDGVYVLGNKRIEDLFGAPIQEILGKTDHDLMPTDLAQSFLENDRCAMERDKPTMNIEEVDFASDGHHEILETVKTPLRDEAGNLQGILGIARDITARIDAEKALREKESKLREAQRMESIGRLAAGVAHDLNNLLTPVLGYTGIVADGLPAASPHQKSLAQIAYAGERARDLVAQLLAFGRRQTLQYRTVDLNAAARGLEKLLSRSLRTNIRLSLDLQDDLPPVRADLGQIEQVVMNLALNAADAMPEGGQLRIATAATGAPDVLDASMGAGPYALLTVQDTGMGMDEETLNQVFEPFFSTKGKLGNGLGLATVHGIVKQHGGEILVESRPGEGTTFRVYLPALLEEKPATADTAGPTEGAEPEPDQAPADILLVEDNEDVRSLAATILERQGYHILQAASGEEALPFVEDAGTPIDLLVTDMVMPGMTGKDLYDRAIVVRPELPVLFMSGFTDMEFSLVGDGQRSEKFLPKPFTAKGLVAMVRGLIPSRQQPGA